MRRWGPIGKDPCGWFFPQAEERIFRGRNGSWSILKKQNRLRKKVSRRFREQSKFMKCIKIRKCHLKLPLEMSGLMNVICYPTWRQPIKFLRQGKYSFNQSHKTTFFMYLVIKYFIKMMHGKRTVCVTL